MAYELVQTRIPYKQVFRYPKPKRKPWCNWFGEIVALRIEVVDPEEAPVAYEVRFGPDDCSQAARLSDQELSGRSVVADGRRLQLRPAPGVLRDGDE